MLSRRWASATPSCAHAPAPSGPARREHLGHAVDDADVGAAAEAALTCEAAQGAS